MDNKNETKPKKTLNLIEDHVKGLKLERDGHINKDYHHEAFLGKMVEEGTLLFDNMEGYRRLIDLFHKVDKDGDHLVSKAELTVWIHEKIKEHIDEAKAKNHELFKEVDRDSDGYVTWKEFQQKLKEDNTTNNNAEPELGGSIISKIYIKPIRAFIYVVLYHSCERIIITGKLKKMKQ